MYKNNKKHWNGLQQAVEELVKLKKEEIPQNEKLLNIYIANQQYSYVIYFIIFRNNGREEKLSFYQISIQKPEFLEMCWGKPLFYVDGQIQCYQKYNLTFEQAKEEYEKNKLFIKNFQKTLDNLIKV